MNEKTETPIASMSLGQRLKRAEAVVVVDFNMPFPALVGFMVKAAIAAIPALIILAFLAVVALAVLSAVFNVHVGGL